MKSARRLLAACIVTLTGATATAGAAELITTDPDHMGQPSSRFDPLAKATPPRMDQPSAGSRVIVQSPLPLKESWLLSKRLSRACDSGDFRQKRPHHFVGRIGGRTYGAAIGGHGSLRDAAGLAEPNRVYLFTGEGSTECRVYHRVK